MARIWPITNEEGEGERERAQVKRWGATPRQIPTNNQPIKGYIQYRQR